MKFTLKTEGFIPKQLLLDDKDISNRVVEAAINIKAGCIPTVTLELRPDAIEIDGEFEFLKEKTKDDYTLKELIEKVAEKLVKKWTIRKVKILVLIYERCCLWK